MEFWRKGLKGAYRLGVPIAGYGDDMFFGSDINSGRIRVDQRQASERGSFTGFIYFMRIAYDCFNKWGGLTPAAETVY